MHGPFESHEQADRRIAGFMLELGEWRDAKAVDAMTDEELCSAVDAEGWIVQEVEPLEPGDGLYDDIHEERVGPRLPASKAVASSEAAIQAGIDEGYRQHVAEMREHAAADGADGRDGHAS